MAAQFPPPLLEVRNLRVEFRTDAGVAKAVEDVSFALAPVETLAVVGESGSGKSVTSLAIMGLIPDPPGRVTGGEILYRQRDGTVADLLRLPPRAMRRLRGAQIAMIFQEPMTSLDPVFTIGRQIGEAVELHRGVSRSEARRRALEMLELVEIPAAARRLDEYPHQLSGGMRQRVMIALALACDPALLIADEPTTALDVTIQAQILALIDRLRRNIGLAVLFITHNLGVVAEIADRVAVMYAGRVVEEAGVRELFAGPRHPYTRGLLACLPRRALDADAQAEEAVASTGAAEASAAAALTPADAAAEASARRGALRPLHRLAAIPGQVASPLAPPPGCAFAPRCTLAETACTAAMPGLLAVDGTHSARCLRWNAS